MTFIGSQSIGRNPRLGLEDRTVELGREIFSRANSAEQFLSVGRHLDDALMGLSMRDEAVKAQLFRFVDVLPSLGSNQSIARHLGEYLRAARAKGIFSLAAGRVAQSRIGAPVLARIAGFNARRMARRFIAAEDLPQLVKALARLRRQRLTATIDLLGEAVVSEAEAEQYQRNYLDLLEKLPALAAGLPGDELLDRDSRGALARVNFSLKLSSLYSQIDPIHPGASESAVLERLRPILRLARRQGVFINFDMEQFALKDLTLRIFQRVFQEAEFSDWANVGIAMQAYLRSTKADLRELAGWAKRRGTAVWVRLVKGAYWDQETIVAAQNGWALPVFAQKAETDANFESCAAYLIENRQWLRPAIASHNIRSLASAMATAEKAGAAARDVEYQMLYGMADPIKTALVEMGRRVRVYAPVGRLLPGMAYLVRRLLENTSNESFLRAGFIEHVPEEQLLMNPTMRMPPRRPSMVAVEFENESPADFSREEDRRAMARSLEELEAAVPLDEPAVIGGKHVWRNERIESIDPSCKSRLVGRAARATRQMAEQAVAAAKAAFAGWRDTPARQRAELLDRVAEILHRDRMKLAALEVLECGKPWRDADADVAEAIDFCRYYAWQMRELGRGGGNNVSGETNSWVYESRGVAAIIAPWNFPLAILCGMTCAAVVAGNAAIMKPAEQSPLIAARLMRAFEEAGAPAGVVNYLPGVGEEIGPVLVGHPDVAVIAFTGSRAVGLAMNEQAAASRQDLVKRVIVEMGGKNAIIIDEDADLDEAVSGVVASAFGYSGQKCSACSRVIALASVYDTFLARLVEATRSLKIAPASNPACKVGPVIDAEAFARINSAIEKAKGEARLAFAGEAGALAGEGYFIGPHIFGDVPANSALAREEIFGPVLAVMRAGDLTEALSLANGVPYALTGGIYSRSPENIARCRREFRVGNFYINRKITGALVGRQPFGGFKLSGGGTQAGGPDYLRHFLLPRCVTENTVRHGFASAE